MVLEASVTRFVNLVGGEMRLRKVTDTSNISKAGVGWTTCSLMEMCQQPRNLVHLLRTAGMSRWFSLGGGVYLHRWFS